jgi:hypothetical protein
MQTSSVQTESASMLTAATQRAVQLGVTALRLTEFCLLLLLQLLLLQ